MCHSQNLVDGVPGHSSRNRFQLEAVNGLMIIPQACESVDRTVFWHWALVAGMKNEWTTHLIETQPNSSTPWTNFWLLHFWQSIHLSKLDQSWPCLYTANLKTLQIRIKCGCLVFIPMYFAKQIPAGTTKLPSPVALPPFLIFNPTFFMSLWVKRDHRFWPIPRCFQASKLWYQMFLQYMTLYDKYQIFISTHIIFIYIYILL